MIVSVNKTRAGHLISIKGWDDTIAKDKQEAIELIKFMASNIVRQADDEYEATREEE